MKKSYKVKQINNYLTNTYKTFSLKTLKTPQVNVATKTTLGLPAWKNKRLYPPLKDFGLYQAVISIH